MAANIVKSAVAIGGPVAWNLIKKGASHKAVKRAGEGVAIAVAGEATKNSGNLVSQKLADKKHRRLAFDLALQTGGSYSEKTVIAGERYFIVWKGDVPIEVFPPIPQTLGPLVDRVELRDFRGVRKSPQLKS